MAHKKPARLPRETDQKCCMGNVNGAPKRLGMGLIFWPRGGSAQVARYLARALNGVGWRTTLAAGTVGGPGERGNAIDFFSPGPGPDGLDLVTADYVPALAAFRAGDDPMDAAMPLHPSYEAKEGVPDRIFTSVSPAQARHAAEAWAKVMRSSETFLASQVLHLHHLTPVHDAAALALPEVPIVTHLHGTDLKMLAAIDRGEVGVADQPHAKWWREHLVELAQRSAATIVISPHDRSGAQELLGLDPSTVHWLPNGVDVEHFRPRELTNAARRTLLARWFVDDPQGWNEASRTPGSIRYTPEQVEHAFFDADTGLPRAPLLYVGRFLDFKRVPMLVRAYARARPQFERDAPLIIWGGAPGEWEGEHPHSVVEAEGIDNVFFAGWLGHHDLPDGMACSELFVAPSTDEPFGQVFLEAMACGLPVVGTLSGGPPSFINVEPGNPDGWLVAPDDEQALAAALVEAVNDVRARRERGDAGLRHVRDGYSWARLAHRFAEFYEQIMRAAAPVDGKG
jgi:D-inositol-3-phosphate glycosyltransferase